MVHAGTTAASPEQLEAWIAGTEDIHQRLTSGGYGSHFRAADLFPLYEGFVAKATAAAPRRPDTLRTERRVFGLIIGAALVIVFIIVIIVSR